MTFDEFEIKLKELKEEYKKLHDKYPVTLNELESYLLNRKYGRRHGKALRSLKGFDL